MCRFSSAEASASAFAPGCIGVAAAAVAATSSLVVTDVVVDSVALEVSLEASEAVSEPCVEGVRSRRNLTRMSLFSSSKSVKPYSEINSARLRNSSRLSDCSSDRRPALSRRRRPLRPLRSSPARFDAPSSDVDVLVSFSLIVLTPSGLSGFSSRPFSFARTKRRASNRAVLSTAGKLRLKVEFISL